MSAAETFWKICKMHTILTDNLHVLIPLQWDVKRRLLIFKQSKCLGSISAVCFLVSPFGFGGYILHLLILNGNPKDFNPNYYTKSLNRRYFEIGTSFIGAIGAISVAFYILPMTVHGAEMANGFTALELEDSIPQKSRHQSK
jgi:hypothetical protein